MINDEPQLGLATTRALFDELEARMIMSNELTNHQKAHELRSIKNQLSRQTLDYRTVDNEEDKQDTSIKHQNIFEKDK